MNAFGYRKCFKGHLPTIFQELHFGYQIACSEGVGSTAESFKQRIMACFRAWEDWTIYPNDFLIRLQNIFLGLLTVNSREEEAKIFEGLEEEEDEDVILRKRRKSPPRAQMPPRSALNLIRSMQSIDPNAGREDLDGVPMDEGDIDGEPDSVEPNQTPSGPDSGTAPAVENKPKGGFIPSKWETIDPEEVKAGAVTTTSKWDLFEENSTNSSGNSKDEKTAAKNNNSGLGGLVDYDGEEDLDGVPMDDDEESPQGSGNPYMGKVGVEIYEDESTEERRLKLREVENKVLTYQDELESGRRRMRHGESVAQLVQEYREKLLRKVNCCWG
jgi:U2-associated protein SR140